MAGGWREDLRGLVGGLVENLRAGDIRSAGIRAVMIKNLRAGAGWLEVGEKTCGGSSRRRGERREKNLRAGAGWLEVSEKTCGGWLAKASAIKKSFCGEKK